MKIGIFGGTFNPPHLGHLTSLQEVQKKAGLDKIYVIPTNLNPLKKQLEGPSSEDRLELTKKAVESWNSSFIVDEIEISRGGTSYTIDTIKEYNKKFKNDELFLILGIDNFYELESWKDYKKILEIANIIFTSRPGFEFPEDESEVPKKIQKLVAEYDFNFIELTTGKSIQFLKIKDIEVSSTEIRKWIRIGKNIEKFVPLAVENYIKEKNLYKPTKEKIGDFKKFTEFCGQVLFDKKGIAVRGFDIKNITATCDYSLIASGTSTRHAASLAENLIAAVKEEFNQNPLNIEGLDEGRWVVVDYGTLIVHIFYDFVRQEYALENMWSKGIDLNLKDKSLEINK